VLGASEALPRSGTVNPRLLPPLSDVLIMLAQLLGRAQVQEAISVTAAEVVVAFLIAVPLGAAIGVVIAEKRLSRRGLPADPVLRLQHPEIDLPAHVHPDLRVRVRTEGRLRGLLDHLRGDHERRRGDRIGQGRPSSPPRAKARRPPRTREHET
jgi:hypothetical protein